MTYCAWECVQKWDMWAWGRREKERKKLSCVNWLFAQTTHVDMAP